MPEIHFESVSMEVLGNLDGGVATGPEHLLKSMGYGAAEYDGMNTNSKSGELFLLSGDRRFIIKTIGAKEYELLSRIMPAYQGHIRSWPRSLIVRFAGLVHVEVPGGLSKHFLVMTSLFDPRCKIHETYDLKGSLFNRKKKPGDGIGKDEDWITSGHRLQLPPEVRREMCAVHELDVMLLNRFRIMDYSVLVGIHHIGENVACDERQVGPQGILSEDCRILYFIGIIDFSIKYSLKKETETLLNVAKGCGVRASCVSEDNYAMRQVRFMRDAVMRPVPQEYDMGTKGLLRLSIYSAHDLIAADWIGTSDPYVRATLGMLSRSTEVIKRNCNPVWNTTLFLPVDDFHLAQDVELVVWDEDLNLAIRGSDDFLGKLLVPMSLLMSGPQEFSRAPLLEVARGSLTVRLAFEPLSSEALTAAPASQPSPRASCARASDASLQRRLSVALETAFDCGEFGEAVRAVAVGSRAAAR